MRRKTPGWICAMLAAAGLLGYQPVIAGYDPKDPEGPQIWKELEVAAPAFPLPDNLKEFYVSAVATNKYMVDVSTLLPGADGVVRYVLVVLTSGGATNTSFEGMNCKEGTWKHYATGRSDTTWAISRAARNEWRQIENKPLNPHHAVLMRNFFCPAGAPIFTAEEGRNAFRLGKHPDSPR